MSHDHNQHIYGLNAEYVEDLYQQYLIDSSSVSDSWREYFSQLSTQDKSLHSLHERLREPR